MPRFLAKFNYIFGPLLECISLYTLYSGVNEQNIDWIATSETHLQILFEMAKSAMFPPIPQTSPLIDANEAPSYAIEGALVLQNMFQSLNGAPLLDQLVGPTVQLVFDKLRGGGRMTQTLKRHLLLTLLSCALHSPLKTLDEIFARDGGAPELTNFFRELIETKQGGAACSHKKLRSPYEVKVYSVALTNIIFKAFADGGAGEHLIPRASLL